MLFSAFSKCNKRGKKQDNKNEGTFGKNLLWLTCSSTLFLEECNHYRRSVCVELVKGEKLITAAVHEMLTALAGCPSELQAALPPLPGPGSCC